MDGRNTPQARHRIGGLGKIVGGRRSGGLGGRYLAIEFGTKAVTRGGRRGITRKGWVVTFRRWSPDSRTAKEFDYSNCVYTSAARWARIDSEYRFVN
jgi:hypothetical protein